MSVVCPRAIFVKDGSIGDVEQVRLLLMRLNLSAGPSSFIFIPQIWLIKFTNEPLHEIPNNVAF